MKQLLQQFYSRNTHDVAKDLLGKLLVRTWRGTTYIARIVEVESYVGENDKACHASKGKTKRTAVMFGQPGRAYVYLIYGMYYCLNVVTEEKDFPAAVLIRGAVPVKGFNGGRPVANGASLAAANSSLLAGPGKLCREMFITKTLNKENLVTSKKLYVADDDFTVLPKDIKTSPRIGVDYAGEDALLPWRYYVSL